MRLKMMLFSVRLFKRKGVQMKHLDTPLSPSAQSGPGKCVMSGRTGSQSTHQLLDAPKNPGSFVPQLAVDSRRDLKCALTEFKLLYKMLQRKSVPLNPRELVAM